MNGSLQANQDGYGSAPLSEGIGLDRLIRVGKRTMKRILLALLFFAATGSSAWANNCPSYTFTLTNGTTADANQVMGNFNTIMNCASFFIGGTSAGSATAQTLASVSPGVFALSSGNRVAFTAGFTTTGATTLNVASTGATNILKKTVSGLAALAANDMISGQVYTVQYDGTQFELLDPGTGAQLNGVNAWAAGQSSTPVALTFGSTITPNFSSGNILTVTLTGNATLANPSNLVAGQCGQLFITQDATGSRTLAYGSQWKFPGGTAPTLTTTANATDILSFCSWSTTQIAAQLTANVH
jgi:hypothetical protein